MQNCTTIRGLITLIQKAHTISNSPQETFDEICRSLDLKVFNVVREPEFPEGTWIVEQEGHA
jgi:hypothetical protein